MGEGQEGRPFSVGMLLVSLPFLIVGGLGVAQAFGLVFISKALVPPVVLGIVSSTFLLAGLALGLAAIGVNFALTRWLGSYVFLSLLAAFNYFAFADPNEAILRIIVVAVDILTVVFWADWVMGRYRGVTSPIIDWIDGFPPAMKKVAAGCILGAPFVVSAALEVTGVLDRLRGSDWNTHQQQMRGPSG